MLAAALLALPALASFASAATHTVVVGGTGLIYTPSELVAAVGDQVTFVFGARNHSVSQSTFATPCAESMPGFDSGYLPSSDPAMSPEFTITINSMEPVWYFCKQLGHCGGGMVGSINAPTTGNETFTAFTANARMFNDAVAQPASVVLSGSGAVASGPPSTVAAAAASSTMASSMAGGMTMASSGSAMMSATGTAAPAAATSAKPAGASTLKAASALGLVGAIAFLL